MAQQAVVYQFVKQSGELRQKRYEGAVGESPSQPKHRRENADIRTCHRSHHCRPHPAADPHADLIDTLLGRALRRHKHAPALQLHAQQAGRGLRVGWAHTARTRPRQCHRSRTPRPWRSARPATTVEDRIVHHGRPTQFWRESCRVRHTLVRED